MSETGVVYTLYAEEPVKAGDGRGQSGAGALSYIPATSIRGALIECLKDEDMVAAVLRDLTFTDCYPVVGEQRLIPCPPVFYAEKHQIRSFRGSRKRKSGGTDVLPVKLKVPTSEKKPNDPEEGYQCVGRGGFLLTGQKKIGICHVRKVANLHIAMGRKDRDSQMYRYEAIAPGQAFSGMITCRIEEEAKLVRSVLQDRVMYIGGSRGSGYGRCRMLSCRTADSAELTGGKPYGIGRRIVENGSAGILTVYALSHLILLDRNGNETGEPDTAYLEEQLGVRNLRLLKTYVTSFHVSGFNRTWHAGQTQRSAAAAGSLWFYTYEGTLDEEKADRFEARGLGIRRKEGFGRILINPVFTENGAMDAAVVEFSAAGEASAVRQDGTAAEAGEAQTGIAEAGGTARAGAAEDGSARGTAVSQDAVTREILAKIEQRVNSRREEEELRILALRAAEQNAGISRDFSRRQIARLYNVLYDAAMDDDRTKVETFRDNLKTDTLEAYHKTDIRLSSGTHNMYRLLDELVDDQVLLRQMTGVDGVRHLSLTGSEQKTERDNFVYKCRFAAKIMYELMRQEGGRNR